MGPEVFLAELEEDLLVRFVGSDESLEVEDGVGVVGEDVVAQSREFLEVIAEFFAEELMLAVHVSVELDVFVVVLGSGHVVGLNLVVVVDYCPVVAALEALEIFANGLQVVDCQLRHLAVLFVFLEQRLKGVVVEKRYLQ